MKGEASDVPILRGQPPKYEKSARYFPWGVLSPAEAVTCATLDDVRPPSLRPVPAQHAHTLRVVDAILSTYRAACRAFVTLGSGREGEGLWK